jgi:environmental stress-induced protein Ves
MELAIEPPDAGLAGAPFLWRLSIADVRASGPFSRYPGYERRIMLIDGNGMTIDAGINGVFALERYRPVPFSGDWEVGGRLKDGPVRDFNFFIDRKRMAGTLEAVNLNATRDIAANGDTVAIHVLQGWVKGYAAGDTLILAGDETMTLEPPPSGAVCAVARIAALR